jgi:dipeptidyl aminopeptidase/acylaminoacyl peptidase
MRKALLFVFVLSLTAFSQTTKPRVTIDEYFNSVEFTAVRISPDGNSVVIGTERADWKHDRFRDDLWLWRGGALSLLTQSGHDSDPQWSPDGRWIAFLSDRAALPIDEEEAEVPNEPKLDQPVTPKPRGRATEDDEEDQAVAHLYVIPVNGGEAFPVTRGLEEVHAFSWAPDSQALYFATRTPWSKQKREAYKKEWKDTIRFREAERGDVIARLDLKTAIAYAAAVAIPEAKKEKAETETAETPGAQLIAKTPWRVKQLDVSPDGTKIAFTTDSVSQRVEGVDAYEIYVAPANGGEAKAITKNEGVEDDLRWLDANTLAFRVGMGSVEGKYEDLQNRLYTVEVHSGKVNRWAVTFPGSLEKFEPGLKGTLLASGMTGTESQLYTINPGRDAIKMEGWSGTYKEVSVAKQSSRLAFVYSALDRPIEIYLADSLDKLREAKPITSFNKLFTERDLPRGKPYQWKAPDGTTVEGMLIYPPGKFEAKNLRMLVLIHGGPADADGNRFAANWYDWAILAASNDWLVFQPNYRGSTAYGDKFIREIIPNLVSVPGRDILAGVDALVKDGAANPDQLAIGGYSYGGYMTNWLITQTTRFKAAVSGAGAVEHAANWGNDDLTFDDAHFLGGTPWQNPKHYQDEAALFIFDRVKTPTHVVGGADDVRVSMLENYVLERALKTLKIPSTLLVFPGEGHGLGKNPWHGKIKVREELKWIEKYIPAAKTKASLEK